jgi:uncharacterized protein involved in cysteine biosynthesis
MHFFLSIFRGASYFFRGIGKLFRHPTLFALALIPIVLTIVLIVALAWGGAYLLGNWLAQNVGMGLTDRLLLQTLVVLATLFLAYLIYLPLTRIFLAPISERLSLRTTKLTGQQTIAENELLFFRAIGEGLKLVALQLIVVAIILPLTILLPPLGVPLGIVAAICFCGVDFLDVPLSLRGYNFRDKWRWWKQNFPLVLGFSLAGYVLLHIPLVNLLTLPVGVVGASLLVDEGSDD